MGRLDRTHLRDLMLVLLTASIGSIDAVSWLGLGKVYSAFQTGNLVVLGFGTAGAPGPPVMRAAVSFAAFGCGALAASRFVATDPPRGFWPPRVTGVLGVVALAQAAFLALWIGVGGEPANGSADVLIGISALAAGLQTGAIFSVGIRAVFTTAATATWTALMSDLAGGPRVPRDLWRLAAIVAAAFAGAVLGGVLMVDARDVAPLAAPLLTTTVIGTAWVAFGRAPEARRPAPTAGPMVGASP
ncbi:MAG TPA: YoaK family protein [Solirubrobacterales bacterium]|nr:YoaK family protein [Solirubrobacterales bacterium]